MNSTELASIGVPAAKTLHATASELERSSIVQALMTGGGTLPSVIDLEPRE